MLYTMWKLLKVEGHYKMDIQSVNSNNVGFGAKIKFARPELKSMVYSANEEYAKNILDRFEAYYPKKTILIDLLDSNPMDKVLVAKNPETEKTSRLRLTPSECRSIECGCQTFYDMLEHLLDKSQFFHVKFWGNVPHIEENKNIFRLENHSIFNV